MPYLVTLIAQARQVRDAAQAALTQKQTTLDTLDNQRETALGERHAAELAIAPFANEIAEQANKQAQANTLTSERDAALGHAGWHGATATSYAQEAGNLQNQLNHLYYLRDHPTQRPAAQAAVNELQDQLDNINMQLDMLESSGPIDGDYRAWYREKVALAQQRNLVQGQLSSAQSALTAILNQTNTIPTVEANRNTAQNHANWNAAERDRQAGIAAARQASLDAITPRLTALNNLLRDVPGHQETIRTRTLTIDSLGPQIATATYARNAAQSEFDVARAPYEALVALVTEIERQQIDRPALQATAAELERRLQEKLAAEAAARARLNEATRRREVVVDFRERIGGQLNLATAALATTDGEIQQLVQVRIPGEDAKIATAEANQLSIDREMDIWSRLPMRPVYNKWDETLEEYEREKEIWGDALELKKERYQVELDAETTARAKKNEYERARDAAQARRPAQAARESELSGWHSTLTTHRTALDAAIQNAQQEINGLQGEISEIRTARDAATARLLGQLPTTLPILFFPVRLETRFHAGNALRVRIYPDDIHVDSHERALTPDEQTWGTHFWQATTGAGDDEAMKQAAWEQLALRFGVPRAAWIAHVMSEGLTVGERARSWMRAPHTRVLPDRWVALGYRDGKLVLTHWSSPLVADTLPVGPSPAALEAEDDPFADPAIAWMSNFDQAVAAGMALHIPLDPAQAQAGFDRLIVLGVKGFLASKGAWAPTDAAEATARLTELLEAHHYTRGLAFVPQGTPTNNTSAQAAGYSRPDPLDEEIYALERGAPLISDGEAPDGTRPDGARAADALGIARATFAHVRHAERREQEDARLANSALFPTFQSPLLEALLPYPPGAAEHFARFVRARGPYPLLRVGNQPYGLLPVSALDRWETQSGQEDGALAARLRTQRPLWQVAGERTARMGRRGDIARILRQGAGAAHFRVRGLGTVSKNSSVGQGGLAAPFASRLGALAERSPAEREALVSEALEAAAFRLDAWVTSLATRRLEQQRAAGAAGIHLGAYGWVEGLRPAPARWNRGFVQAPSIAQANAAAVLRSGYLAHKQGDTPSALAVDLSSERVRRARWLLDGVRAGQPLGALLGYRFERALQDNGLAQYIAPFRTLAALRDDEGIWDLIVAERDAELRYRALQGEVARLRLLLADAVREQVAAQAHVTRNRQEEANAVSLRGLLYGAAQNVATLQGVYDAKAAAVVEHNRPHNRPRAIVKKPWADTAGNDYELPTTTTREQWRATLNALRAAEATALNDLNLAKQARDNLAGGSGRYDDRVKKLSDAIDQFNRDIVGLQGTLNQKNTDLSQLEDQLGRTPNAGKLGEEEAAKTARDNASLALRAMLDERWEQARESIAAHNVVDGLELHRRWQIGHQPDGIGWTAASIPWGDELIGLPDPDANYSDHEGLSTQLAALSDAVDAVSDVLTAEGVYQLVQGNPTRAGTTLDAIASGEVAPPDLEVIRTPRTGTALTHRLLALAPAEAPDTAPWGASDDNPRALAEPYLNQWVAQWVAPPSAVAYRATFIDPATGEAIGEPLGQTEPLTLAALGLSPLDALYLAESTGSAAQSELEQRIAYHLIQDDGEIPADTTVALDFGRAAGWAPTTLSVAEWLENLRALRLLVTQARAADARDFAEPGPALPPGVDLAELQGRAQGAVQRFGDARSTLLSAIGSNSADPLREALRPFGDFGLGGAIPVRATGDDEATVEALVAQARGVEQEATRRLAALQRHDAAPPPSDAEPAALVEFTRARFALLFGEGFRVLPVVIPPEGSTAAFDEARALEGTPLGAVNWLQQMAHVRPGAGRLARAAAYAEAVGSGASLTLRVGQLPVAPGDRWIALPTPEGQQPPEGRLSMVAHAAPGLDLDGPLVGLMVDEWVEVVPNRTEVTGLAFHYNQPSAQAPQSLLLAVAPELRADARWDLDTLATTLRETAELARGRAAAPESLAGGLWHTARQADGTWEPFTNLDEAAGEPEPLRVAAMTVISYGLHIVAGGQGGGLWHSSRDAGGAWREWENLAGRAGDRGAVSEVACATAGGLLHLSTITPTGIWHTIRFASGEWQPFGDVHSQIGARGTPVRIASTSLGDQFHLFMVNSEGQLWYTRRAGNGSWLPWLDVKNRCGQIGMVTSVTTSTDSSGQIHVVASSTTGLWHAIQYSVTNWTLFGDVHGQVGTPGFAEDLASAGGLDFQLRVLAQDGQVWHTTRLSSGAWLPLTRAEGIGLARRLASTGNHLAWHIADIAAPIAAPMVYLASEGDNAVNVSALP